MFTVGRSSRQAASDISWDKMAEKAERDLEIRRRRRDRKRKAGTKTSNGVGDEGKEEREAGREKMRTVFIHPVSTNYHVYIRFSWVYVLFYKTIARMNN